MKLWLRLSAFIVFVSGCTTFQSEVMVPPRGLASNSAYVEQAYQKFFEGANNFEKIEKIETLTSQFYAAMPEKGHAKKMLVRQFLSDIQRVKTEDINSDIFHALGRILASYKIMSRLGIYLTASGVFEAESSENEYYFAFLDRVMADIETQLRNSFLIYRPEDRVSDENNARLFFINKLAAEVRQGLTKVFPGAKNPHRKLDQLFMQLSKVSEVGIAKRLSYTGDFISAAAILNDLHIVNSGEIDGFQDEVELTLATKFNFGMINELLSAVRLD